MNLFKWIAGSFLTIVLLILLAILIAPRVVDPNDFRDEITALVKAKTGRELQLTGDLSVSIFPWLGIRTNSFSLSQPAEIGGDMVAAQSAQIRVKLVPLLSRRVEVDTIVLESPQLNFITLSNGINSFSGLSREKTVSTKGEGEGELESDLINNPKLNPGAALALVIQGLEVSDGRLLWDDRQADQRYQINELDLESGNLLGQEFASLNATGIVIDASAPQPINFSLDGNARIDSDTLQLMAQDLNVDLQQAYHSLELKISGLVFDQTQDLRLNNTSLIAKLDLSSADSESESANVSAEIEELLFNLESGQISVAGTQANLAGILKDLPELDLKTTIPSLKFNTESNKMVAANIAIQTKAWGRDVLFAIPQVDANFNSQTANIDSLRLDRADLSASFSHLRITQFIQNPAVTGALQLAPFNAANLLQELEIEYAAADSKALQSVALKTNFSAGQSKIGLTDLELALDQSTFTGSFSATDFDNAKFKFDLALDQLDLDSYLPADDAATGAVEQDTASGAAALAVPMALLKQVNANGSFKADQLVSGGLELTAIDVQIVSSPGNLTITPKADLYEGKLGGSMVFTENGNESKLQIKNQIDLVSLAKFLSATDVSKQLSGIGSLVLDLVVTEKHGVQTNQGTIKLFAKNGAIKGVDIKKIVDQGYRQYKQLRGKNEETEQESGASEVNDETRFAELLGTFHLEDFKITNNDFHMKAPLFRISGEGDIDLVEKRINYLTNVSIVKSTSGQGGEALEELKGITLPIRFSGSLTAPHYALDMRALYQGLAKKEIEDKKSAYLEEKLGIEDGGKLSTKELLRQILINEVSKKSADTKPQETSPQEKQPQEPQTSEADTEETSSESNNQPSDVEEQTDSVPDVYSDPNAQDQATEPEEEKSSEDQLKDELKKQLLEGLFN